MAGADWTYGDIRSKILIDYDLDEESFVTDDELIGYCNEGIKEAESEIHTLSCEESYFLTQYLVPLVQNTQNYALPSDIFASKIRGIVYHKSDLIYEVHKIRRMKKFLNLMIENQFNNSSDLYRYILVNPAGGAEEVMQLWPTSRETDSTVMTMWYIRDATKIPLASAGSLAASELISIDIPEFYTFIIQYMRSKVSKKISDPRFPEEIVELEHQRKLMIDTLSLMIPDDDDEIELDMSHYWEHS